MAVLTGDVIRGTVHFAQSSCGSPVTIEVNVRGLNAVGHGFHIHETGDLSNGCLSLAAHYNPHLVKSKKSTNKPMDEKFFLKILQLIHAGPQDQIRHVGDLGNIFGDANGNSNVTFTDHLISLAGARNVVGRGVIIHQNIDDLGRGGHPDSSSTGNAGPRVACGVIGYV